jgi:hypothetical protein
VNDRSRPGKAASGGRSPAQDTPRTITPEQARGELARRKLPRGRRHEGRDEAVASGAFFVSKETLLAIAEGRP